MPIWYGGRDLFNTPAELVANTVNLQKIMGRGLAKTIRERYNNDPRYMQNHIKAVNNKTLAMGQPYVHAIPYGKDKFRIIDIPTKDMIYDASGRSKPSNIEDVRNALINIANNYKKWGVHSIAMPLLGTGKGTGQLPKKDVGALIEQHLGGLDDLDVYLTDFDMGGYEPKGGWRQKGVTPIKPVVQAPISKEDRQRGIAALSLYRAKNRLWRDDLQDFIEKGPVYTYNTVLKKGHTTKEEIDTAVKTLDAYEAKTGAKSYTIFDEGFPRDKFITKYYAAPILYYKGADPSIFKRNSMAIIGSRAIRDSQKAIGRDTARRIGNDGTLVVSGLAYGADTMAHEGSLGTSGNTVAILSTPLYDTSIYPEKNQGLAKRIVENGGMLLTEHSPLFKSRGFAADLADRSLIQAMLGDKVLVLDANVGSDGIITGGTRHAVNLATKLGKPIYKTKNNGHIKNMNIQEYSRPLEVSTAGDQFGSSLSAFNLKYGNSPVEAVYQGSKRWKDDAGNVYSIGDITGMSAKDAKSKARTFHDREKKNGRGDLTFTGFNFEGNDIGLDAPEHLAYDYIYAKGLKQLADKNKTLFDDIDKYDTFTDKFFVQPRSRNSQALAIPTIMGMHKANTLDEAMKSPRDFAKYAYPDVGWPSLEETPADEEDWFDLGKAYTGLMDRLNKLG